MSVDKEPHYERERRFLVADTSIVRGWEAVVIRQSYVLAQDGYAVRIRLILKEEADGRSTDLDATVAVKGPRIGDEREEYETSIDTRLAAEIIARSQNVLVKKRYQVIDGVAWDVDEFLGENAGLMIAELEGPDVRGITLPAWASKEVTYDERYNNDELAQSPYKNWENKRAPDELWDS